MFLEISQNSQENTCARVSFLIKFAGLRPATLLKISLWHRYFPSEHLESLLLFGPILHKEISYLWNVGQEGYNVYEEDNLYNAVSTMLEQHCLGLLFSQCCLNTSKTTLHKKCWLKAHRFTFAGKMTVSSMSGSLFLTRYYTTIVIMTMISLNNLGPFCSMLAREFIYQLRDNNEQVFCVLIHDGVRKSISQ